MADRQGRQESAAGTEPGRRGAHLEIADVVPVGPRDQLGQARGPAGQQVQGNVRGGRRLVTVSWRLPGGARDHVPQQDLAGARRGAGYDQPAHAAAGGGEPAAGLEVGAPLGVLADHDEARLRRVGDIPQPGDGQHRGRPDTREREDHHDQPRLVRKLDEHPVSWAYAHAAEGPRRAEHLAGEFTPGQPEAGSGDRLGRRIGLAVAQHVSGQRLAGPVAVLQVPAFAFGAVSDSAGGRHRRDHAGTSSDRPPRAAPPVRADSWIRARKFRTCPETSAASSTWA